MTYAVSFMLMAAGLILLIWTIGAALRYRTERDADWEIVPHFDSPTDAEYEAPRMSMGAYDTARTPSYPNLGGVDWYDLQCRAGRGVRYAPNMGGYTEVPMQLHDAHDNRVYVRKRIWVN